MPQYARSDAHNTMQWHLMQIMDITFNLESMKPNIVIIVTQVYNIRLLHLAQPII